MMSPEPAQASGLELTTTSLINYRGSDAVPPAAELTGWQAPMFYTSSVGGDRPTGYWAPGDTWERSLVIRNVDTNYALRLSGIKADLSGQLALAQWYSVVVRDSAGRTVFQGALAEMGARLHVLTQDLVLTPGQRETFTFTVHLDINTDQRLQGTTVVANLLVEASVEGYTLGKVTAGTLQYGSGRTRRTGGFVVMAQEGDAAPKGQLQFQDHGRGIGFHADRYTDLLVSLDRTRSWFSGTGRLNGEDGYTFRARAYDLGEPGSRDEFEITIYDRTGRVVYASGNLLGGGNVQIHK